MTQRQATRILESEVLEQAMNAYNASSEGDRPLFPEDLQTQQMPSQRQIRRYANKSEQLTRDRDY